MVVFGVLQRHWTLLVITQNNCYHDKNVLGNEQWRADSDSKNIVRNGSI